jgi:AcrR family transcriptional regulator
MKTIRQIADEIGVSKQAVYKRYKGKLHTVCAPYAHTEQGVLYLSEQAETLIKQDFLKADRSNGAVSEQLKEADVVSVLQATIDTLQEQLEVKDQQIEKLTEALLAAQKTAAAAQALHAGMIQQQFLTNRDEIEEQGEGPVERQGWLRRLFHGLFL